MNNENPKNKFEKKVLAEDNDFVEIEFEEEGEELPKVVAWKMINRMEFPTDRFRVENLIPRGGIVFLASISGEGKTMLMLELCRALSKGEKFLNHFATVLSRVLYINLEMAISEMQRRGRSIGFEEENQNLFILNHDNFNLFSDTTDKNFKFLLKFIYDNKIDVIVIDTFRASAVGMKEEKAEEVRKFLNKFLILKDADKTVIFLEHHRKPNNFEGNIPKKEHLFGSQDKVANAEILLMLRAYKPGEEIHMYQRKNRLGKEIAPFVIRLKDYKDEKGVDRIAFEYGGDIDEKENKKEKAKEIILSILQDGATKTRKEIVDYIQKEARIGSKNASEALRELEDDGKLDMVKIGKQNSYFLHKEDKNSLESNDEDINGDFIDSS